MRNLPSKLQDIVNAGGPFFGDKAPRTVITVQPDWWLNTTNGPIGNRRADKLPIRWFQSAQNDQTEVVVPNVKSVTIDRSLHEDAGTLQVVFYNTKTPAPGTAGDLEDTFGEKGYYSWARGESPNAQRRWSQNPNEWSNILRENALLRVYQGYGPKGMGLADLLKGGYVILNGVFLVDNVAIDAQSGMATLNGRDMAKLLIEQHVWPPLVPQSFYTSAGVNYFVTGQSIGIDLDGNSLGSLEYGKGTYVTGRCAYAAESGSTLGHDGPACVDGNPSTYWLSDGYTSPSSLPWIEFDVNENMTSVYMAPYQGNYICYVSVYEKGSWATGAGTINGVPYVSRFGVPGGSGQWHDLPQQYSATKIRLTFSNLFNTGLSGGGYRVGMYEVGVGGTNRVTRSDKEILDIAVTSTGSGYRLAGSDGGVFDYGDAAYKGSLAGKPLNAPIVAMDNTPDAAGYWLCGADGGVFTLGDAGFYGSAAVDHLANPAIAFRATPSGRGYWITATDGGVFTFGDATFYGAGTGTGGKNWDGTGCVDMAVMPNGTGYWLLSQAGDVRAYGSAQLHGNLTSMVAAVGKTLNAGEYAVGIESTPSGNGYWIITNDGGVFTGGDASFYGSLVGTNLNAPITKIRRTASNPFNDSTIPTNGNGYYLVANDGGVFCFGDAQFWGSLLGPDYLVGTYKDYADIIEDLCLWAGFFYSPVSSKAGGTTPTQTPPSGYNVPAHQKPSVFGNIETTGAYNSVGPLDPSTNDKVALIDFIKRIKDTVGFICRVDETGGVRFECVDEETEALTRRGWKTYDQLLPDDEFYSYNPASHQGEWTKALAVNSYEVQAEKLVSLESQTHSSLTTKNHRWWSEERKGSRWRTSDSLAWESRIPRVAPTSNADAPYSDAFVELVGWWFSEGHDCGSSGNISQSLSANPEKVERIRALLRVEYGERGDHLYKGRPTLEAIRDAIAQVATGASLTSVASELGIDRHDLSRYVTSTPKWGHWAETCSRRAAGIRSIAGGPEKLTPASEMIYFRLDKEAMASLRSVAPGRVPVTDWLLSLSARQLRLFIKGALLGDGNETTVRRSGSQWRGYWRLTQKSTDQVEAFEMACTLAGLATSRHRKNDCWTVNVLTSTHFMPKASSAHPAGSAQASLIEYTGTVWCPTLVANQIWLARRNGHVYFTGNSPNYWTAGNFLDDGTPIKYWPQLDEKMNMTGYIQTASDDPIRSEIIVSATDPYKFGGQPDGVYVTRYVPPYANRLRGIVRPAMIGVPLNVPISPTDQEIMAELLALQIFFASRQGQVSAAVNPAICPNDQVQIWDRVTGEANIHYVVGVHTEHDLQAGTWNATYQTYWLGTSDNWSITTSQASVNQQLGGAGQLSTTFYISPQLQSFLVNSGSASTAALAQKVLNALAPDPNPDATGTTTQVVHFSDPGYTG